MSHDIRFYKNSGHSPAWPMITHAQVDLEARGLTFQPYVPPMWSDPCMVARTGEGTPSGFLIYRYDEITCSWFIILAYVSAEHRRKGVHTALFSALVERAKERGDILTIECGTHINNTAAQAAFKVQGRSKTAIMYSFRLKDWLEGQIPTEIER